MTRRANAKERKRRAAGLLLLALLAAAVSLPARPAAPMASSPGFYEDLASKAAVVSEGFAVYLADLRVALELPRHASEMRKRGRRSGLPSPPSRLAGMRG